MCPEFFPLSVGLSGKAREAPGSDLALLKPPVDIRADGYSAGHGVTLIRSNSRDEDHLAKIAAAEKAGLALFAELTSDLRKRNQPTPATVPTTALAA
jgi:hypothetical protein